MASTLDQLRTMTIVVADTGDLEAVRQTKPQDCTTNPSIVLKALQSTTMSSMIDAVIARARTSGATLEAIAEELTVRVGADLAGLVPGFVSTEVDARLSFDIASMVQKAKALVARYAAHGVDRERILIKLAATWEGIRAAEQLESEGIRCNLTLLFSLAQAKACADAGVFLISPFVGRITDWHVANEGKTFAPEEDPGVLSVRRIYQYYKAHGIKTVVMGASFRNTGQIAALAGCDRLTIAPEFLAELAASQARLPRVLCPGLVESNSPLPITEAEFRWQMNKDSMAAEKLAEGIRAFDQDHQRLLALIGEKLSGHAFSEARP